MLVSFKAALAIFAMPKTGTTAVETALSPLCDLVFQGNPRVKHMTVRRFERFIRPYLNELGATNVETTSLIREPEDWLASWHRYRARDALRGHPNSTVDVDFETFVAAYLSPAAPAYAQVGRPARFLTRRDGSLGIDHLFRYEDIDAQVALLAKRLRQPIVIPRRNVSPGKMPIARLSPSLRAELETQLAEEFELYENARSGLNQKASL